MIEQALVKETRHILSQLLLKLMSNGASLEDFLQQFPLARNVHNALLPLEKGSQQEIARHQVAAITNQVASTPGKHGVSFRKAAELRKQRAASPDTPTRNPQRNTEHATPPSVRTPDMRVQLLLEADNWKTSPNGSTY